MTVELPGLPHITEAHLHRLSECLLMVGGGTVNSIMAFEFHEQEMYDAALRWVLEREPKSQFPWWLVRAKFSEMYFQNLILLAASKGNEVQ